MRFIWQPGGPRVVGALASAMLREVPTRTREPRRGQHDRLHPAPQIRAEFSNGRDYYALHGRAILEPESAADLPSDALLRWHSEVLFLN